VQATPRVDMENNLAALQTNSVITFIASTRPLRGCHFAISSIDPKPSKFS
jgi:hypothetical protein